VRAVNYGRIPFCNPLCNNDVKFSFPSFVGSHPILENSPYIESSADFTSVKMPEDWEYSGWGGPPETWDVSLKPYKDGEPLPDYMCVNMLSFFDRS
jgi:hypothetical protein